MVLLCGKNWGNFFSFQRKTSQTTSTELETHRIVSIVAFKMKFFFLPFIMNCHLKIRWAMMIAMRSAFETMIRYK